MNNNKLYFISLGCDKNKVDSEKILDFFINKKHCIVVDDVKKADIAIVNTCSFIEDAKLESIDAIKELYEYKKQGKLKKIYVYGCLAKEFKLAKENNSEISFNLEDYADDIKYFDDYLYNLDMTKERAMDILSYSSSIKISDGCNKNCSYCIIPKLRGKLHSNSIENIYDEAKFLAENGTTELNIVSQDTLSYGVDLYKKKKIIDLLDKLSNIDGIKWIRLLYCYPESIDDEIIDFISKNDKILNYIDMPIQHINNRVLKLMNRPTTKESIIKLIDKLRNRIPNVCLRTTVMVGFPSETDKEFDELIDFLKDIKFDKLGCFKYSDEKLNESHNFAVQISEDVKLHRREILLEEQYNIIKSINKKEIGNVYEVLVEGYDSSKKMYVSRNYKNARDIDDLIYFKSSDEIISGEYKKVKITKSLDYDLIGDIYED